MSYRVRVRVSLVIRGIANNIFRRIRGIAKIFSATEVIFLAFLMEFSAAEAPRVISETIFSAAEVIYVVFLAEYSAAEAQGIN